MDQDLALHRLQQAVRHVAETQALIARQKALIDQLKRDGQTVLLKRAWLKLRCLEREQAEEIAKRDRVRQELGL